HPLSVQFFGPPRASESHTLSLHDALPISLTDVAGDDGAQPRLLVGGRPAEEVGHRRLARSLGPGALQRRQRLEGVVDLTHGEAEDRKSTRLNSSHVKISYAVFCLKKKYG